MKSKVPNAMIKWFLKISTFISTQNIVNAKLMGHKGSNICSDDVSGRDYVSMIGIESR